MNTNAEDTKKNVPDVEIFGNVDQFQLICKASSKQGGWMKSTKAMELQNGCVVQVSTQLNGQVAEALCFVPGASIHTDENGNKYLK